MWVTRKNLKSGSHLFFVVKPNKNSGLVLLACPAPALYFVNTSLCANICLQSIQIFHTSKKTVTILYYQEQMTLSNLAVLCANVKMPRPFPVKSWLKLERIQDQDPWTLNPNLKSRIWKQNVCRTRLQTLFAKKSNHHSMVTSSQDSGGLQVLALFCLSSQAMYASIFRTVGNEFCDFLWLWEWIRVCYYYDSGWSISSTSVFHSVTCIEGHTEHHQWPLSN